MVALRFYEGTGRAGGPVAQMDEIDAYFWANRHRAEADRQARIKARREQTHGNTDQTNP